MTKWKWHFCLAAQEQGVVVHQLVAEEVKRPVLGVDPLVSEAESAKPRFSSAYTKTDVAALSG